MKKILVLMAVLLCTATGVVASDAPRWEEQGGCWITRTRYFELAVDYDPVDSPAIQETLTFLDQMAIDILETLQHEADLKVAVRLQASAPAASQPCETGIGYVRIFDSRGLTCPRLTEMIGSGYVWNAIADLKVNETGWAGRVAARYFPIKYRNLVADPRAVFDFRSSLGWPLMIDGQAYRCSWATIVSDNEKWLSAGDKRAQQTDSLLIAMGEFIARAYGEQSFGSMLKAIKDGIVSPADPGRVFGKSQNELEDEFYLWLDSEMGGK